MPMVGRSFSASSYRWGYQGSEKDNEISNKDNEFFTTFYREGSTPTLQWLTPDYVSPTAGESPYAMMGRNPIWFTDVLGDKFKIGAKDDQAKTDVKDQVKNKNQKYLKFQEDGEVKTDFGELNKTEINNILKKDKGLGLIYKLSTAKNDDGSDMNFFYGTEGNTGIGLENPQMQTNVSDYYSNISSLDNKQRFTDKAGGYDPRAFILNASSQQYSSSSEYGLKPLDNYAGKVFIGRGTFMVSNIQEKSIFNERGNIVGYTSQNVLLTVSRTAIVFHELNESFLRTVNGSCYEPAHNNAGGISGVSRFYPAEKK